MVILHRSKTPAEQKPYIFDFKSGLPANTTITSAQATCTRLSDGVSDTSVLQEGTLTVTDTTVRLRVIGGTSGETYRIAIAVSGNDAFLVDEIYVILRVRDVPFS